MHKNSAENKNSAMREHGAFHAELDKIRSGFSLSCSGVLGISEYSDTEIVVRLSGFSLKISGAELCMTVFEEKRAEIIGKIKGVSVLYAKS